MNAHINFTNLFEVELLKPDGSNFIDWYQCLRSLLKQSNAFFTIIEPLGPGPDEDADEVEEDAFRDKHDYYTLAEAAILSSMEP
jgi:hypothetical protein